MIGDESILELLSREAFQVAHLLILFTTPDSHSGLHQDLRLRRVLLEESRALDSLLL